MTPNRWEKSSRAVLHAVCCTATMLALLIRRLRHPLGRSELVCWTKGVFHVLILPPAPVLDSTAAKGGSSVG